MMLLFRAKRARAIPSPSRVALRALSSGGGGRRTSRRHTPHSGYGHDILGDTGGFQPLSEEVSRGVDGLFAHGTTSVESYSSRGFVVNGVQLPGAVLLLPDQSFLFSAAAVGELTPASLTPLLLLEERPELLILGCGERIERPPPAVGAWAARHGLALEVLNTRTASSTLNFMVQEQRPVAAVLFPPGYRRPSEGDESGFG